MLIATGVAAGQSGEQTMIMRQEHDGGQPTITYFAGPDFAELRQPDFTRSDLPIFRQKLILSEDQFSAVQRLLGVYLEDFKKLALKHLPKGMPPGLVLNLGEGPEPGAIPGEAVDVEGEPAPGELELADLAGDLPEGVGIGVMMRIGEDVEGEPIEGDQPAASVSVSIEGRDGEELSPELRKQLEEQAAKIAEQIKQQLENQAAGGEGGGNGPMMIGGPDGPMDMESMQAHQEEMKAKAEAFRTAKADLRQSFVAEVQTTLAEPQLERWPALERALTRVHTLPKGQIAGERIDLLKVLDGVELTESDRHPLVEQLDAYEITLDTALRQRNEFLTDADAKINQAMQAGDPDKALSIIDRVTALRVAVRTVNKQFLDTIASLLPAEKAAAFRSAALRSSYPRVYTTTHAQRAFAAAKKIDDLNPETTKSLAELERAYATEREDLNAELRQIIDRHQPLEQRRGIEQVKAVMSGGPPAQPPDMMEAMNADPIAEAFQRRRGLDERYDKSIRELLTPEQVEHLPKPPRRGPPQPVMIEIPAMQAK